LSSTRSKDGSARPDLLRQWWKARPTAYDADLAPDGRVLSGVNKRGAAEIRVPKGRCARNRN